MTCFIEHKKHNSCKQNSDTYVKEERSKADGLWLAVELGLNKDSLDDLAALALIEIGRASCRERV